MGQGSPLKNAPPPLIHGFSQRETGHICPSKNIFEDVSYTWESWRGKKATWQLAAPSADIETKPGQGVVPVENRI